MKRFFAFLAAAATLSLVTSITPVSQINVLYSLYNQTNGKSWLWRNEITAGPIWTFASTSQKDPCNTVNKVWQGITCSSIPSRCQTTTCNIVEIDLGFYGLKGAIPSDLYTMTSLTSLILDRNRLSGTISSLIGSLSHLENLIFSKNRISGTLPPSIGSLSRLVNLYLSTNQITGTIPLTIGSLSQLLYFDIGENQISGTLPLSIGSLSQLLDFDISENLIGGTLPSFIGSFYQLQSLIVSTNQFSGPIPSSFVLLSQVTYFQISNNQITGPIPSSIGSLSNVQYFFAYDNLISGTIPPSIMSLSLLQYLWIASNFINGTIPSLIGSLSQLLFFDISYNQISGTIPPSIGSLSQLQDFGIDSNKISGTIPSSIGLLSVLESFEISLNGITGSIPSSIGSLSRLVYFQNDYNRMSGAIPSSIGLLSQLEFFLIRFNQFSGTLPSTLGSLSQLVYFDIPGNQISGPIPSSMGSLSLLLYFWIYNNRMSGTIPSSMGSLSQLQFFEIYSNQITGTIPSSLNNLSSLRIFSAFSNHLTGTLPLQLISFANLYQFFLQENQLSGSLDSFLFDYFPTSNKSDLINLDVSGNQFTGTIPHDLFLIPSLDSIALSVNCFEGELPRSICDAVNVSVMSLDGLRASTSCKKQSFIPFTSVSLGRMMEGSIPDCVWKLSNLYLLHLAGNGFRGRIDSSAGTTTLPLNSTAASVIMPRLVDLTLSHNYLSGEIPDWLLEKSTLSMDLSHNMFTGDLVGLISKDDTINFGNVTRILKLGVNRLSGRLPSSMAPYATLDILSGNLFSCETIPEHDENSEYYACGSSQYNQSMIGLGGVIGLLMFFIGTYFLMTLVILLVSVLQSQHGQYQILSSIRNWCEAKKFRFNQLMKYLRYYDHHIASFQFLSSSREEDSERNSIFLLIKQFGKSLVGVEKLFLFTTIIIIVSSIPLYVLKAVGKQSYVTHSHQYQWYLTLSYLSGIIPGLLSMMICLFSLLVFRGVLWYLTRLICIPRDLGVQKMELSSSSNHTRILDLEAKEVINTLSSSQSIPPIDPTPISGQESSSSPPTSSNNQPFVGRAALSLYLILIANIVIVGTVNGLYIWSTVQKLSTFYRFLIQLSVSLFGMLWLALLRNIFADQRHHYFSVVWLLCLIGVINGVLIPCLVTSLTSPSCYQRLIIQPEDISSSYFYTFCSLWLSLKIPVDVACVQYASSLMTVPPLTPPFAYSYQCGSTLLTSYIPVNLYSSIFKIIVDFVRVILIFYSKDNEKPSFIQDSAFLRNPNSNPTWILSSVITNMILLLSFGLSSPVLCVGICASSIVRVSYFLILAGRFIFLWLGKWEADKVSSDSAPLRNPMNEIKELELKERNPPSLVVDTAGGLDENANAHAGHEEGLIKEFLVEMKANMEDGLRSMERCKWLVIIPSCLFMTVLSWDIAGEQVGWEGSYWIPLIGVGIMMFLWLLDYYLMKRKE